MSGLKYREYFDIDEKYFPCVDESAIRAGIDWRGTYPHETFIDLLEKTDRLLSRNTGKSLWIHGAYGTGKSQCAFTLKKILEVPDDELIAYWNQCEPLREKHSALLQKLISHKKNGILTAWRYASGSITTPRQLFMAFQESISAALDERGSYKSPSTLKDGVLSWLEDKTHADFVDSLLRKPEWSTIFAQSSANEIISSLKRSKNTDSLMENIFAMSAKEGITALDLTADTLREWIIDVIHRNDNLQIVFIWDEFSDFFRNNLDFLGELQKITAICQEAPFYFIPVTHEISSLVPTNDSSAKKIRDRFTELQITLPDNIAFDLTANAFLVKDSMLAEWLDMQEDMYASVQSSVEEVMKAAKISSVETVKNVLPIHPMAALILKNIASVYKSNQRSMFDFIKAPLGAENDIKAFQWYISNYGYMDDRPLLTVDMLWDFFYDKSAGILSDDAKLVLGVLNERGKSLSEEEQSVLKAVLIMQAVHQRMGNELKITAPTDENIMCAFKGGWKVLEASCTAIAQDLVAKGVLIKRLDEGGMYSAAILAGDGAKIEKHRETARKNATATKLIADHYDALLGSLHMNSALSLRYEIALSSVSDIRKTAETLRSKNLPAWKFRAVLVLARDESESNGLAEKLREMSHDEYYSDIAFIDATRTPLGDEDLERYVNSSAMSSYYAGSDSGEANNSSQRARQVIEQDWAGRISAGDFTFYSHRRKDGEKSRGWDKLSAILQANVLERFGYVLDFTRGVTQTQLSPSQLKQSALVGLNGGRVTGLMAGQEKNTLAKFWDKENWLNDESFAGEPVVIVAKSVHDLIEKSFDSGGSVSIGEICGRLSYDFGFSVCNLSAFIAGFILRDYSSEPYRYIDENNHSSEMTPIRLAEMLADFMSRSIDSYIVKRTKEEREFYSATSEAWNIPHDEISTCTPELVSDMIHRKAKALKFPLWCLEGECSPESYSILDKYISLAKSSGNALDFFMDIGRSFMSRPETSKELARVLQPETCRRGMLKFLASFEGGRLLSLAEKIGAGNEAVMHGLEYAFSTEYSDMWNKSTALEQIRDLTAEYEFADVSNEILHVGTRSKDEAINSWRENLNVLGCSFEDAAKKYPALRKILDTMKHIASHSEISPGEMKEFTRGIRENEPEITELLTDTAKIFRETYSASLEGLNDEECERVRESVRGLFMMSSAQAGINIRQSASNIRNARKRGELLEFWREKTNGTKNPREWSRNFMMPVLCCVSVDVQAQAKKFFDMINGGNISDNEADEAIRFIHGLDDEGFFDSLKDKAFRDERFSATFIKDKSSILDDVSEVQSTLMKLGGEPYDWTNNPAVKAKIDEMTEQKYRPNIGKVMDKIDGMSESVMRAMLKKFAENDSALGMRIITWSE